MAKQEVQAFCANSVKASLQSAEGIQITDSESERKTTGEVLDPPQRLH